jgi:hypothetical protein
LLADLPGPLLIGPRLGLGPHLITDLLPVLALLTLPINFRARRVRSIWPVPIGPPLHLLPLIDSVRQIGSLRKKLVGFLFGLVPPLRVLTLELARLLDLLRVATRHLHSALVYLIERLVQILYVLVVDVHLFSVQLPRAHPDVNMGMLGVLVDNCHRLSLRKLLL